jgi:hypothetical protein
MGADPSCAVFDLEHIPGEEEGNTVIPNEPIQYDESLVCRQRRGEGCGSEQLGPKCWSEPDDIQGKLPERFLSKRTESYAGRFGGCQYRAKNSSESSVPPRLATEAPSLCHLHTRDAALIRAMSPAPK